MKFEPFIACSSMANPF